MVEIDCPLCDEPLRCEAGTRLTALHCDACRLDITVVDPEPVALAIAA